MFTFLSILAIGIGSVFALSTGLPFFGFLAWVGFSAICLVSAVKAYSYYVAYFTEKKKIIRDNWENYVKNLGDSMNKEENKLNKVFNNKAIPQVKDKKFKGFAINESYNNIDYKTKNVNYVARCTFCGRPLSAHKSVQQMAGDRCLNNFNIEEKQIIENVSKLSEKVINAKNVGKIVEFCNVLEKIKHNATNYDLKSAIFRMKVNLINKINENNDDIANSKEVGAIETELWQKDSTLLAKIPKKLGFFEN